MLPPLAAAYALFLSMVLRWIRRPPARPGPPPGPPPLGPLLRLAASGYAAFLAIVAVFHVWLAGDRRALPQAIGEGAVLLGMAVTAFVALSWIEARLRRRRAGPA
ncbi:MAG TPA: DUF6256 family protein [Actinomycetota bacterium]|nr:DUF6256 family protein [Actinomycetota bacterium]